VRDGRSHGERRGRIHPDVAARVLAGGQIAGASGDRRAPGPMQVAVVLRGSGALRVGHRGPCLPGPVIFEELHEHVVERGRAETDARRHVDERLESEAVSELVQEDGDEIDQPSRIAVEPQVPAARLQAPGRADLAVELGEDVVGARLIDAADLVRERLRVVRVRKRGVREVGVQRYRTGTAQNRTRGVAGLWVELCADDDRDVAGEDVSPDRSRVVEHVQPLLAERHTGVAGDRSPRRWIVEALTGAVIVDDGDGRGVGAAGDERQQGSEHERQQAARAQALDERHDYFSSNAAGVGGRWFGSVTHASLRLPVFGSICMT